MSSLSGKVALITGAGGMKGVGRAVALKLASQGADIVLTDVRRPSGNLPAQEIKAGWKSIESVAREVELLGRKCLPVWCDLLVGEQIQSLIQQAATHFGHLDILVNNARAIMGEERVPITELAEEVWQRFLAINTTAAFLTIKYAGQIMIKQGTGGRIVNVASEASKRGRPRMAAYVSSKFALIGLAQCAALELAPHRITVNSVCPGSINSDRFNYGEAADAAARGMTIEQVRAEYIASVARNVPLGRIAESEDVANLVAFLASDEANFITGQAYNINGGTTFH